MAGSTRRKLLPVVDAAREWRARLTWLSLGWLLFLALTGLAILLLPFGEATQFSVVVHTLLGVALLPPVAWYSTRHLKRRWRGRLNHYQVTGYIGLAVLIVCCASGLVLTWNGLFGLRRGEFWHLVHLFSGLAVAAAIVVHLAAVAIRPVAEGYARKLLRGSQFECLWRSGLVAALGMAAVAAWAVQYEPDPVWQAFSSDYNWRFGVDRPFAPSNARLDYGQWRERVITEIAALLPAESRGKFRELANNPLVDIEGLYKHVRAALDGVGASEDVQRRAEQIMTEAAHEIQRKGAAVAAVLANSARCGTSGCHEAIYQEWRPSAHRYSSMDTMFQAVQEIMARETAPEYTRYCAGCHDPISLFAGAKNPGNITLSVEGANEGSSCVICHSIVQTDTQGNADYTLAIPVKYAYELDTSRVARIITDFLIRTYPEHHVASYSRPLYKTAEYCAACHKQYIDTQVNRDIGRVNGQNQYDSWKNSRWNKGDGHPRTITCRECHMPLLPGVEPASGDLVDANRTPDDGLHRSHRFLASNQYMPIELNLPGAEEHVRLIEEWLRGEYEIPEVADKWTTGPVVRMELLAPDVVHPGEEVTIRVILTNNKTGHDFPTGPLDMIESWVELVVTDEAGNVIHHKGEVSSDARLKAPLFWFKADLFDRRGEPVDRHNLWDVVGARYKRALYPGMTDAETVRVVCPSLARPRLSAPQDRAGNRVEEHAFQVPPDTEPGVLLIRATLWYRKANPEFLKAVFGIDHPGISPRTAMVSAEARVRVQAHDRISLAE